MIIGITGKAGSGKDTVADILVRNHGFVRVGFADPMKRFVREVLDFTEDQLWGPSSMRNAADPRYPHKFAGSLDEPREWLSPRYALQTLGTEWGRHCYYNMWVDYALRVAEKLLRGGYEYDAIRGLAYVGPRYVGQHADPRCAAGVVISDVRFHNEANALKAKGARLWKTTYDGGCGLTGAAAAHASEAYIDGLPYDSLVRPCYLEELPSVVADLLRGEQ